MLLDRKVVRNLIRFRESNRTLVGIIAWLGFRCTTLTYEQAPRLAGKSSFTPRKLFRLAMDAIISFSYLPLRLSSYLGVLVSVVSFVYAVVLLSMKLLFGVGPTGWPSVMVAILFLGGVQLIMLGVLGEYVWRGLEESRNRPLYIVMDSIGTEDSLAPEGND